MERYYKAKTHESPLLRSYTNKDGEAKASSYQQFSFFTLSKSEALALARTSFRVNFIATHWLMFKV